MANSGKRDDNGSQFFLTLGDTKELTGKNTLFGKIVGDTIYNLVRMGELEVEGETERPLFPPKIISAEVLVNPFEDVKPREIKRKAEVLEQPKKPAAKKKKGGKQLLSFAEDEDDAMPAPVRKKPKFDTRLVVAAPEDETPTQKEMVKGRPKPEPKSVSTPTGEPATKESAPTAAKELTPPPPPPKKTKTKPASAETTRSPSRSPTPPPSRSAQRLAETNAQIAALKKSLRRSPSPPPAAATAATGKKKSLLALQKEMLPSTSIQGRKKLRKRGGAEEDDDAAFAALQKFREKLATAPPPSAAKQEERSAGIDNMEVDKKEAVEEDTEATLCDLHFIPNCQSCSKWDEQEKEEEAEGGEVSSDLWSHALSFEKDRLGKDLTWKKKNEELVVIDPREKQREIFGKRKGGGGDRGSRRDEGRRREARR
jgi:peptidyl-prolyl cis-trans isomerase SDCCAG10